MKRILSCILVLVLLSSLVGCGGSKCTSIVLGTTEVSLSQPGETKGLSVTKEPSDTADKTHFKSSDPSVATVDEHGLITAVGAGSTTITVTCGDAVAFCTVVVVSDGTNTPVDDTQPDEMQTEPSEQVCSECGGKGGCQTCGGNPVCPQCGGHPVCSSCQNSPGECSLCEGKGGTVCNSCHGEWECARCKGTLLCIYCEGDGLCSDCEGTRKRPCSYCEETPGKCSSCEGLGKDDDGKRCVLCRGSAKCRYCNGNATEKCTFCEYRNGKCAYCQGDGVCGACYGRTDLCPDCNMGLRDCKNCVGGKCSSCDGEPVCQRCGGDGKICNECNDGECSSCGAKPDQSTVTINPTIGGNNPSTSQQTNANCYTCKGDGLCPYCGGAYYCKNNYCSFGRVDCSSCSGTGDCGACYGSGYFIWYDKDCPSCSYGACRSCGGSGNKICTTCGGSGVCNYCMYGRCPTCGGL